MIKGKLTAFAMALVLGVVACKPLAKEESRGLGYTGQDTVSIAVKRKGEQTYLAVCPHETSCANALLDKEGEPFYFAKPISVDELNRRAKGNIGNRILSATFVALAAGMALSGTYGAYRLLRNRNFKSVTHGAGDIEELKSLTTLLDNKWRRLRNNFSTLSEGRVIESEIEHLTESAAHVIDRLKESVSDKAMISKLDSLKRSVEGKAALNADALRSLLAEVSGIRKQEWEFVVMSALGVPFLLHMTWLMRVDPVWKDRAPDLVDLFAHGKPITVSRSELTTLLAFVADKSDAKINNSVFKFFH